MTHTGHNEKSMVVPQPYVTVELPTAGQVTRPADCTQLPMLLADNQAELGKLSGDTEYSTDQTPASSSRDVIYVVHRRSPPSALLQSSASGETPAPALRIAGTALHPRAAVQLKPVAVCLVSPRNQQDHQSVRSTASESGKSPSGADLKDSGVGVASQRKPRLSVDHIVDDTSENPEYWQLRHGAGVAPDSATIDPLTAASSCTTAGFDDIHGDSNLLSLNRGGFDSKLSAELTRPDAKTSQLSAGSGIARGDTETWPFNLFATSAVHATATSVSMTPFSKSPLLTYSQTLLESSCQGMPGLPGRKSPSLEGIWSTQAGAFSAYPLSANETAGPQYGWGALPHASLGNLHISQTTGHSPLPGPPLSRISSLECGGGTLVLSHAATPPQCKLDIAQRNVFRTASWDSLGQ